MVLVNAANEEVVDAPSCPCARRRRNEVLENVIVHIPPFSVEVESRKYASYRRFVHPPSIAVIMTTYP
jgi:hypothetical protein